MADIKIYGVLTSATGSGELARAAQITVRGIPLGVTVQEVLEALVSSSSDLPDGAVIDPNYVHTDNNYSDQDKSVVVTMQMDYQSLVDTVNTLQGSLITLNPLTHRVNHVNTYQVVLDSMGEDLDGELIAHGDYGEFYYDGGNLWYGDSSGPVSMGPPSPKVIYCNKNTNRLYRWDTSNGGPPHWEPVGGIQEQGYQPVYNNGAIGFSSGQGVLEPEYLNGAIIM